VTLLIALQRSAIRLVFPIIPLLAVAGTAQAACSKTISAGTKVLQPAINSLKPGETLCLHGGVYSTGGSFGTSADTTTIAVSGTSSAPITVRAYGTEKAIVHGQTKISGSYLKILGLTFEGPLSRNSTSATERRANLVEFSGSHHVTFENNEVRKSDYHAGVYLANVNNIRILRCYMHDNGRFNIDSDPVTGDKTYNVDHGIYWGSTNGGNNVISDSLFVGNRGYGVQIYPKSQNVKIIQNTFVKNGNSGLIVAGSGSDYISIVNNISASNGRNKQIRIKSGSHNLVRNNIAYSSSSSLSGIDNSTSSYIGEIKLNDPKFISSTDFHLQSGSPAIDSALPSYSTTSDRSYVPRPQNTGPDVGAYERRP
jgi:hypothetical protein